MEIIGSRRRYDATTILTMTAFFALSAALLSTSGCTSKPEKDITIINFVMITEDTGRLVVAQGEGDGITGLITRNGIARFLQIRGK